MTAEIKLRAERRPSETIRPLTRLSRRVVSDQCSTSLGSANFRLWLKADIQRLAVRGLLPARKRT